MSMRLLYVGTYSAVYAHFRTTRRQWAKSGQSGKRKGLPTSLSTYLAFLRLESNAKLDVVCHHGGKFSYPLIKICKSNAGKKPEGGSARRAFVLFDRSSVCLMDHLLLFSRQSPSSADFQQRERD